MRSSFDSSLPAIRDSTNGGAPFRPSRIIEVREATLTGRDIIREDLGLPAFKRPEGCYRKDTEDLWPAVADEHGNHQVFFPLEHLERQPAPHEAPVQPNATDALYAAEFERLDRALEANFGPPQAVPSSVTGGSVAILGVVNMATGGEVVFGSVLEEHELTGQAK